MMARPIMDQRRAPPPVWREALGLASILPSPHSNGETVTLPQGSAGGQPGSKSGQGSAASLFELQRIWSGPGRERPDLEGRQSPSRSRSDALSFVAGPQ